MSQHYRRETEKLEGDTNKHLSIQVCEIMNLCQSVSFSLPRSNTSEELQFYQSVWGITRSDRSFTVKLKCTGSGSLTDWCFSVDKKL